MITTVSLTSAPIIWNWPPIYGGQGETKERQATPDLKVASIKARELRRAEYIYTPVCQILEIYIEALTEVVMYTIHRVSMISYSLKAVGILGQLLGTGKARGIHILEKGGGGAPPMAQVQLFGQLAVMSSLWHPTPPSKTSLEDCKANWWHTQRRANRP